MPSITTHIKPSERPAIAITPVESSQLHSAGFTDGTLAVTFKSKRSDTGQGPVYHIPGVTQDEYDEFMKAESLGTAYGKMFKPRDCFCLSKAEDAE